MAKDKKNNAPLEEEEREIFILTDEEGKEGQYELIDEIEVDGSLYYAMVPIEEGVEEYVILKVVPGENGEDTLESVDDDDEFDKVADIFDDRMMDVDHDAAF